MRFGRLLVWCMGSFAAVALVTLGEWYRGVIALQEPPARPELTGASDGMRTLVWTDKEGVGSSDTVRLWVLCDNQTGADVTDLHFLSFETPGFEKVNDHCWQGDQPVCSKEKPQHGLPPLLKAGRAVAVYAELRPLFYFGRYGASGILVWKSLDRDFQRALMLPGVEFHSEWLDWISGFVKAIELCALPVMLALLAWRLKWRDEAHEAVAKDERDWQVRLQETWNLQLPRMHESTTKYYMPLMGAIARLLEESEKLNLLSPEEELQRGLYRLLVVNRRAAELAEKIGGFFFKDLEGEALAANCWNLFEQAKRKQTQRVEEDVALILDVIQPRISLAQFMELIRGSQGSARDFQITASLNSLASCLREWTGGDQFRKDVVFLEILLRIFEFEVNRPAELWYGRLPQIATGQFNEAVQKLPDTPPCKALKKKLDAYRMECEAAAQKSSERWGARRKSADLLAPRSARKQP
jgi:hypothetical protein